MNNLNLKITVSEKDGMLGFAPYFLDSDTNQALVNRTFTRFSSEIKKLSIELIAATEQMKPGPEIEKLGFELFKQIIPKNLKKILSSYDSGGVLFLITPNISNIPFELLFTGNDFIGLKYNTGIIIDDGNEHNPIPKRKEVIPREMLLVCDPCGNLAAAKKEGDTLKKMMEFSVGDNLPILRNRKRVEKSYLRDNLCNHSIFHYCGHAVWNGKDTESGLILRDGLFSVHELRKFQGVDTAPDLVFLNACQSANGLDSAGMSGLAGEFLKIGCKSFIGALAKIPDESAEKLAIHFYQDFHKNASASSQIWSARCKLSKEGDYSGLLYRFFGDPLNHKEQKQKTEPIIETNSVSTPTKKKRPVLYVLILIGILLFIFYFIGYLQEINTENKIKYYPPTKFDNLQ